MASDERTPQQRSDSLKLASFECPICFNILIDPVVGSCGHDFCKVCLERWTCSQLRQDKAAECPLCREVLAEPFDDRPRKLRVCLRLKETLETLFPDKIVARRKEMETELAEESVRPSTPPSQTQGAVQLQDGTQTSSRRRFFRVRRHHAPTQATTTPSGLVPNFSNLQSAPSPASGLLHNLWAPVGTQLLWGQVGLQGQASSVAGAPAPQARASMVSAFPASASQVDQPMADTLQPFQWHQALPTPTTRWSQGQGNGSAEASQRWTSLPLGSLTFCIGWGDPVRRSGKPSFRRRRFRAVHHQQA